MKYQKWQEKMVEAYFEKLNGWFSELVECIQEWLEDGANPEETANYIKDMWDEVYDDYESFLIANQLWDDGCDEWREGLEHTLRQKIYSEIDKFFNRVCHHVETWFDLDCKLSDLCTE